VLREKSLLLEPLKWVPKTANSRHSLPVFQNPVKAMVLTGPNQAWAADIAYIRTGEEFLYLSLLTDMRSRKTAGCHAGDTLETALAKLPEGGGTLSIIQIVAVSIVRICMSGNSGREDCRSA
jgi:transposase InsO family protein